MPMVLGKIINTNHRSLRFLMILCVSLMPCFMSSCGYDFNPDPHLKGRGVMQGADEVPKDSIYCNSAIRSSMIGDYTHTHQVRSLSLTEVHKAVGGNYVLLDGSHQHNFYLSSDRMGALLRKREIIVYEPDHKHNVSLECAR
jgi:hypothetical protein